VEHSATVNPEELRERQLQANLSLGKIGLISNSDSMVRRCPSAEQEVLRTIRTHLEKTGFEDAAPELVIGTQMIIYNICDAHSVG